MSASQSALIFLHVPRTGGTTFASVIKRQYHANAILPLYDSDFGEELRPSGQNDLLRVVMGHFYFGAHTFLRRPCRYITLLRDPIERIISDYYYVRRSPAHHFYDSAQSISLEEFVEYCSDNDQTRQLAGKCGVPSAETSLDELLNIAKANLTDHFPVVGITEEFDRPVVLAKRMFDWKRPFYTNQNATRRRPRKDQLSQETLRVIEAHNEADIDLYRYAKDLLHEQVRAQGAGFEGELRSFKKLNRAFGRLGRVASPARRGAAATIPVAARLFRRAE
jgi:hypothetical protein